MKYGITDDVLVISSDDPGFEVISTGVKGGRKTANYILNIQVPSDFPHHDPEGYINDVARSLQLKGDYVALLTAVDMRRVQILSDACATVFVTAGIKSTVSSGTINIIVVSPKALSEGAMAASIITATESKTRALFDIGCDVTGTPTDAVIVAYEKSSDDSRIPYAGLATHFGRSVGSLIRQAIAGALNPRAYS